MQFDQALAQTLSHEGGHVHHPQDPGGETQWGISKRSYPHLDIAALTRADAAAIYRRDFWDACACDALPPGLRLHVFDFAVNSGVGTACKALQIAAGADPDGVIGPRTLQAIGTQPLARVIARLSGQRLHLMAGQPTWPAFGRGWARRMAANLMDA